MVRSLVLASLLLAGCAGSSPSLPPTVGGGHGSEFGNYAAAPAAEPYIDADGDRCPVWNWDRPLSATRVLRIRSASCPAKDAPGRMIAIELGRTIVPMSDSHLADEHE